VLVVEVILAQSIDAPIVIMRKLLSENLLIGQKHWLKRHKRN